MQIVNSTSTPISLQKWVMFFNDVDGQTEIKEMGMAKLPQSYTVDTPSDLTMSDDGVWIKGVASPWGIIGSGNSNPELNFGVTYNDKSEIVFRLGAISEQNGFKSTYRKFSVEFSCVNNFLDPTTYDMDFDNDGVNNAYDLDSDNDGIYDLEEVGLHSIDLNGDGKADGSVGSNGLNDSVETSVDSDTINFTITDSNGDGTKDYLELDSDGDGCHDVIEAGFSDPNNDGLLGTAFYTIDGNGKRIPPAP